MFGGDLLPPRRSGAQVSSDYVCYVAYVRYVSNLSETQRSRQTTAGRWPCGDLAPQLALLPGPARACGDVAAGARFHSLRFRYVFYVAHVGYVETIADRSLTGKTAERMRAAVAVAMPRLRKAMRAVVGKRADESCIRYVFYVLYVGYVAAHRCLAACALGPRGALREAISRRTSPGRPLKNPVLIDAQAGRDASGSSVSATFSTSATSPMSSSSACRPREAFADPWSGPVFAGGVMQLVGRYRRPVPSTFPTSSTSATSSAAVGSRPRRRHLLGDASRVSAPGILALSFCRIPSLSRPSLESGGGRRRYRKSPYGRAPCLGNPYVSYVSYVV